MSLSCGIVGLPNVGKSTLFSTLTKSMVESQNYPFTTIDPNIGIVNVPDERLNAIAAIINPQRIVPSTVQFVDVAGLVKGASQGEGLGNKFLSHIREVDAIIQVVRLFDDKNIIHVNGKVDPLTDLDIIITELILSDIETLMKRKQKIEKQGKAAGKDAAQEMEWLDTMLTSLNENIPLSVIVRDMGEIPAFVNEIRPLTIKPMLIAANMDEQTVGDPLNHPLYQELSKKAAEMGMQVIAFCAKLELDLFNLDPQEQEELMELYNIKERGLEKIIRTGYDLLKYMSYFTAGEKEVRSWTITQNTKAPQAAGVIHTDFEKGFIRAEVIHYQDFIENNGEKGAREKGKVQIEGKEYVVQDGDIMLFRFNV